VRDHDHISVVAAQNFPADSKTSWLVKPMKLADTELFAALKAFMQSREENNAWAQIFVNKGLSGFCEKLCAHFPKMHLF
jgi:hypothetical protein